MIWVAWRQHRWEILGTVAVAGALATALLVAGARAWPLWDQIAETQCGPSLIYLPRPGEGDRCLPLLARFYGETRFAFVFPLALIFLPALAGSYLAGPLVAREYERGTHRVAWTQGVSRTRWFLTNAGLLAAIVAAAALLNGALGVWARVAWDPRPPGPDFDHFDFEWPIVFASTLLALGVGLAASAATRRVLPAVLLTALAFGFLRFVIATQLRPRYLAPLSAGDDPSPPLDGWLLIEQYVETSGALVLRYDRAGNPEQVVSLGYAFHPVNRYWSFQAIEAALLIGIGAACFALALWLINRRIG
jgi:hypothetical protein